MFGDKPAKVLRFNAESLVVEAPEGGVTAPITVNSKNRNIPGPLFTYYEVTAVTSGYGWPDTVRIWRNGRLAYHIVLDQCMDAKFNNGELYVLGRLVGQVGYQVSGTFVQVDSIAPIGMEILNGEVYIVGTSSFSPAYWHAGEIVRLPLDSGFTSGQANAIGMDEGNVYVGGYQCVYCGSEYYGSEYYEETHATVWKNSVPGRLSGEGYSYYTRTSVVDLTVDDGVVYAVSNPMALWIDGVGSQGAASDFYPVPTSIEIVRGDVYITGAELRYGYSPVAKVWKNGTPGKVTDDIYNSVYTGIRVVGKDAFVIGKSYYKLNNRIVPVSGSLFDIMVN